MTKIQWLFLLCLLASCGADNNQQNSEPAQGLRQIPKNPYAIEWADTVDIFVWRARLLDTLGNVWGEQLLIKDIDTLSLMPHATLWLCRGRDSVQLPRIQLFDQRAVRQPRVAVIELWEDSLHSLRKQIKIPAGYDGVAFDIKRPEELKIVQQIEILPYTEEIGALFKDVQILERNGKGEAVFCRAIYNVSPNLETMIDTVHFKSFDCYDKIPPVVIPRKHRTAHTELWIRSQVFGIIYRYDFERTQKIRSYQVFNDINVIMLSLQRLLMRKQLAPESLASAKDKIAQLVEALKITCVRLESHAKKFDLFHKRAAGGLTRVTQRYISLIEQAVEILTTDNSPNDWQILEDNNLKFVFYIIVSDRFSWGIHSAAVSKDVSEAEMTRLYQCFPPTLVAQIDAIIN